MLIKWPLIGFKNSYKNIETYIFSSMGYLDDIFLIRDKFNECENAVLASVKLITNLGDFYKSREIKIFPFPGD